MLGRKNVNIGDFFVLRGDFGTENLSLQSFYFELFFICFVMIKSVKTLLFVVMLCLSVTVMAKSAGRDYWIDRYLSVSYPLKSIKVNSSFGARKDPFTGEQSTHSGLDLQAHYEEVYSMFDGSIEQIGSDPRSGNYVILRHGSYTVSYCHMSRITVRKGEEVIAGAPVGISGNSGRSTGPHLHITCKYKGEFRDPYTLLVYIKEVRAEAVTALGVRNRDNKFHGLKHKEGEKLLMISVAIDDQQACICVKDNGPGFDIRAYNNAKARIGLNIIRHTMAIINEENKSSKIRFDIHNDYGCCAILTVPRHLKAL